MLVKSEHLIWPPVLVERLATPEVNALFYATDNMKPDLRILRQVTPTLDNRWIVKLIHHNLLGPEREFHGDLNKFLLATGYPASRDTSPVLGKLQTRDRV